MSGNERLLSAAGQVVNDNSVWLEKRLQGIYNLIRLYVSYVGKQLIKPMTKLTTAFQQFDNYNKKDPNVFTWNKVAYPQEYFLALKLHEWVLKLEPDASEALLLASRSQHIGRWETPRESYPDGRDGYLKWRKDLALFHSEKAGAIMEEVGYDTEQIARVE